MKARHSEIPFMEYGVPGPRMSRIPPVEYPPAERSSRLNGFRGEEGLYFSDGMRRIDYVFIYEESIAKPAHILEHAAAFGINKKKEKTDPRVRMEYFLRNLVMSGLETEMESSEIEGRRMIVVKLHATWETLCREAEVLRIRMPLKLPDPYEETMNKSTWKKFWNLEFLKRDDDQANVTGRVFWPFDRDHLERFLIQNKDTFFSHIQRSEIVWHIMQSCCNDPEEKERRGIEGLLEEGIVDSAYPLHQGDYKIGNDVSPSIYSPRQRLHRLWATARAIFKPQPVNRIRNYFGEKVAFYFAFTQFYTHSLLFPGLFGLIAFLYGLISVVTHVKPVLDDICNENGPIGRYEMCPICQPPVCEPFKMYKKGCGRSKWQYRLDNEATLIVSVLTILWCALFLKYWRRRQARLAMEWQTYDTHQIHTDIRPDYEERATERRLDPITAQTEPHVPTSKRAKWIAFSALVTLLLLVAAAAGLCGLIASRFALYKAFRGTRLGEENVELSRWLVHLFMYILVTIFEKGFHAIVEKMTIMECPKTDSQFYRSLLWKTFIFAEMVDFLPIAYAAWVKGRYVRTPIDLGAMSEMCEPGGCMAEVVELVAVLLIFRLILGNIIEFTFPVIKAFSKRRREKARLKKKGQEPVQQGRSKGWPRWLKDYHLDDLELDGISKELMEMMIQISFIVFFVPALTLAPLVCFINNIIEIRVDASNFLATHRRPTPARVPNLEIWNTFLDIILKLGVLVNAALIAFTSEIVPRLYYKYRVSLSNTFVGYSRFSMSRLNVSNWEQLREVVKEVKESLKPGGHHGGNNLTTSEHGARFTRSAGAEETAWIADMTECRYFDYRHFEYPYSKTDQYWHVLTYRLAAFALFAIGFYVIIFLINSLIKDVPADIDKKIKRHQYIMTKYLEELDQASGNRSRAGSAYRSGHSKGLRRQDYEPTRQRRPMYDNGGGIRNVVYVDDET